MKELIKKIVRGILPALNRIVICPVLFVLYKLTDIKVSFLYSARIAHMAFNACTFFYRLRVENCQEARRRIVFSADPSNRQLFDMWKRYIPLREWRWVVFWFYSDFEYLRSRSYIEYLPFIHTEFKEMDQAPKLEFTSGEMRKGRELLESMGVPEDAWFVSFQARDDLYHHKVRGQFGTKPHRNSDINTYLKAAHRITERGGYAIHVNAWSETPLDTAGNDRIIDYAFKHRTDFGDIFLLGNARFLLGSSAGSFAVPPLFKVPVILANQTPPRVWPIGRRSLMMPKMLADRNTGELIPFSVLETYGAFDYLFSEQVRWDDGATFEKLGIVAVDNSADDLVDACFDMFDMLDGKAPSAEAREIQAYYKRKYCASVPAAQYFRL